MINGALIKYYRKQKGLTQTELATGICSVGYLSKVENDKIDTSEEIALHLCERLDILMDTILQKADDTNDSINKKLYEWYNCMNNFDDVKAQKMYPEIIKLISKELHFEQQHLFNLFLFRYYVLINNFNDAEKQMNNLNALDKDYSSEFSYYYLKFCGIFHSKQNHLKKANDYFIKAESIYNAINIQDPELFYQMSITFSRLKKFPKALLYATSALNIYQEKLDYERITEVNMIFGIIYTNLKDYELAEEYYMRILTVKYSPSKENQAKTYHNLGQLYFEQDNYETAVEYLLKAISLKESDKERLSSIFLIASSYQNLKVDKSEYWINMGQKISSEVNNKKYIYKFIILNQKDKINNEFLSILKKDIIPFFESNGEIDEYLNCISILAEYFYNERQYKKSADYYKIITKINKGELTI